MSSLSVLKVQVSKQPHLHIVMEVYYFYTSCPMGYERDIYE